MESLRRKTSHFQKVKESRGKIIRQKEGQLQRVKQPNSLKEEREAKLEASKMERKEESSRVNRIRRKM